MRGTPQDFGDQLAVGCRARSGSPFRHRDVSAGDTLKADLGDPNGAGRKRAGSGFDDWMTVTGIRLRSVGGTALTSALSHFGSDMSEEVDHGVARPVAPMPDDVIAVRGPHGSTPVNGGDTVHGPGGDADGPLGPVLAALAGRAWEPTRRSPTAIDGRNARSTGT